MPSESEHKVFGCKFRDLSHLSALSHTFSPFDEMEHYLCDYSDALL